MNNQQQPEEIDILQFFNAIGNFFKSIVNSIINALLSVFYLVLDFILYLKKHYIYLGAGILLGVLFAFFSTSRKKNIYISKALVHTNYQSQYFLQEKFDAFNYMIKNHKKDVLAKELGIDEETAKQFVFFEMEPMFNDVLLIDEYDNYLRTKDTVVYQFIEYKDFKKEMMKNPQINTYWELSVKAYKPEVFGELNKALKDMIESNEGIAQRQQNLTKVYEKAKEVTLKSLQDIDSMRVINNKILLKMADKDLASQAAMIINKNNNLTSELVETEYNLFDQRIYGLLNYENSILLLNKYTSPLVYLSSFPAIGKKEESILYNKYVLYALLGFSLVLFVLLMIDFNKYLNKYQQRKQEKISS